MVTAHILTERPFFVYLNFQKPPASRNLACGKQVTLIGIDSHDDFTLDPEHALVSGNGTPGSDTGEFRFHFPVLPGDYNQNGVVDATEPAGDGNGDGVIDAADDLIGSVGDRLPITTFEADFNDDEIVDGDDFLIWQTGFGQFNGNATGADGDADGDGFVTGNDFLIWQQHFGEESAWYGGGTAAMMGGGGPGAQSAAMAPSVGGPGKSDSPSSSHAALDVVLARFGLNDGEDADDLNVIFSRLSAEDWNELATAIVALSAS